VTAILVALVVIFRPSELASILKTGDTSVERACVSSFSESIPAVNSEDRLIREFLATRDPLLFEELITAHIPWLRRMLFTIFNGNEADMQDAEQEILAGILTDLSRFRFRSSFKTFFYRYARNKAIDFLRTCIRMRKHEAPSLGNDHAGHNDSPEEQYIRKEEKKDITAALLELTGEEREIVLMKDVEGFSIEEISAMTGVKSGTIKSRLSRTREKLFGILKGSTFSTSWQGR
jgi:RNA polymerase sigma-70 factor (ECF subfamily)